MDTAIGRARSSREWIFRIVYTVADQGLSSGANFGMNLLLARWLTGEQFGVFALTYGVFLLFSGIHNAMVMEPIGILGVEVDEDNIAAYFGRVLIIHLLITISLGSVIIICAFIAPLGIYREPALVMAGSIPFLLFPWVVRRMSYMQTAPHVAAGVSLAYVLLIPAMFVYHSMADFGSGTAFFPVSLVSLLAGCIGLAYLPTKPSLKVGRRELAETLSTLVEHWQLGKWIALQTVFTVGSTFAPMLFAAISISASAAGSLRILALIVQPMHQVMLAIGGSLMLPVLAKDYASGNRGRAHRRVRHVTLGLALATATYLLLLVTFRDPIARTVFDEGALPSTWLVPLYGVAPLIGASGYAAELALRAARKTLFYPLSTGVPAIVGLVSAPLLTFQLGITGSTISVLLVTLTASLLSRYMFIRWLPVRSGAHP